MSSKTPKNVSGAMKVIDYILVMLKTCLEDPKDKGQLLLDKSKVISKFI